MIRRDMRVLLKSKGNNAYDVTDKNGKVLLVASEDYFIYFKNVNFRKDGSIDGRYLGNVESGSALIDGHCRDVYYGDDGFTIQGGGKIRTAKMVAVNNKSKTIVIIQQ